MQGIEKKVLLLVNYSLWWSTLYLIWNQLWSNVCWLQGLLPTSNNTITHLYYYCCQIPFFSFKTRKIHNTLYSSINNFSITWQSMLNWSLGGGFVKHLKIHLESKLWRFFDVINIRPWLLFARMHVWNINWKKSVSENVIFYHFTR